MPKPMYVWSGSAWVSVASEVESLATYATQSYADSATGSKLVVPSSVAVGSGSGSVGTSGAVTFSGASSVSLNDCFSSTYDNYLLLIQGVGTSASADLNFRLRVSGTDASGATDYVRPSLYNAQNSSTVANAGGAATSSGYLGFTASDRFVTTSTFFNPFLSQQTFNTFHNYGANYQIWGGSRHALTTSYTGLTLIVTSGTITGNIRVYGMKN